MWVRWSAGCEPGCGWGWDGEWARLWLGVGTGGMGVRVPVSQLWACSGWVGWGGVEEGSGRGAEILQRSRPGQRLRTRALCQTLKTTQTFDVVTCAAVIGC